MKGLASTASTAFDSSVGKSSFDYGNLDRQIAQLFECKPLPEAEVKQLCEKAKEILME